MGKTRHAARLMRVQVQEITDIKTNQESILNGNIFKTVNGVKITGAVS